MEALPVPVRGGSLELLRPFVNVAGDEPWHLFVGYLIAAFRPNGPYLVLVLHGEQGSARAHDQDRSAAGGPEPLSRSG